MVHPSIILLMKEILKESARIGKTPEQLLDEAGQQTAANEQQAVDLLARLKA
jgi:hypothetical protein